MQENGQKVGVSSLGMKRLPATIVAAIGSVVGSNQLSKKRRKYLGDLAKAAHWHQKITRTPAAVLRNSDQSAISSSECSGTVARAGWSIQGSGHDGRVAGVLPAGSQSGSSARV